MLYPERSGPPSTPRLPGSPKSKPAGRSCVALSDLGFRESLSTDAGLELAKTTLGVHSLSFLSVRGAPAY